MHSYSDGYGQGHGHGYGYGYCYGHGYGYSSGEFVWMSHQSFTHDPNLALFVLCVMAAGLDKPVTTDLETYTRV
jgi:hypothetical protein